MVTLVRRKAAAAACVAGAVLGLGAITGCGSSSSGSTSAVSASAATKPGAAKHRQLVVFALSPAGINYLGQLYSGMRQEAAAENISLRFIYSAFNQTQQNGQVLQQLASGSKPDAYVWIPDDQNAGLAALRKLWATKVPVFESNIQPLPIALPYIKFYEGTSFIQNGAISAPVIADAVKALKKIRPLHSPNGNLVILHWPQSLTVGGEKQQGLDSGLKALPNPPNVVDTEYSATPDNQGGFQAMNTAISKVGSKTDVVYAMNDAQADGAIQALTAAGYQPGKNVMVVGGNCFGDFSPLVSGRQFSSMVVAGPLEGSYFIKTAAAYFNGNGKVVPGEYTAPATAGSAPTLPAQPHQINLLPQTPLVGDRGSAVANQAIIDGAKLWGQPVSSLCGVAK